MKRVLAAFLTAGLMAALVWSGLRRAPTRPPDASTPEPTASEPSTGVASPAEAAVHDLLSRASAGDVAGYLDAFAGPLKDRLGREVDERGRAAFADDLRRAALARKSHAVFAPEPDGPDAVLVVVESVYPDRNERQTYRLERVDAGWLVSGVETVKGREPKSRFGTPAVFIAPEGVPVQGGVSVETGDEAPEAGEAPSPGG